MRTRLIRLSLFAGAGALFVALSATSAFAQRAQHPPHDAWCRDVQLGWGGGVKICSAYTYAQCMAGRTSHVESCYLNPLYDPRFAGWRRRNPHY